jgi:hypothetical protein
MMPSRVEAVCASVVLLLGVGILSGCSGDGSDEAKPSKRTTSTVRVKRETPAQAVLRQVADEIGCTETVPARMGYGFSLSEDCRLDGQLSVRIHTFDARNRGSVVSRMSARYDSSSGLTPCPDGSLGAYQWVVIGPDWAVVTIVEAAALDLQKNLDGEILDDGGNTGPPISYPSVNPCPE